MSGNDTLAPCPFDHKPVRGVSLEIDSEDFGYVRGSCEDCGAAGPYVPLSVGAAAEEEKELAITLWNAQSATKLEAQVVKMREALTPSVDTKAAYIGEFSFSVGISHPKLGSEYRKVDVPWTTVKEIMAAILERAALKGNGQ